MKNNGRRGGSAHKNDPALKRKIIIALVILACAVPLLYLAQIALERGQKALDKTPASAGTPRIYNFYEPDYDADINLDEEYLDKNRYIEYTEGVVSTLITGGNHELFGVAAVFFRDYFAAATGGDAEAYNALFTDEYYEENEPLEKFTKQRVYNISVEKISSEIVEKGKYSGYTRYIYRVSYMIMKNDGTFRSDMGSDAALPLAVELIYDGQTVKINSVARYASVYL